MSTNFPRILTLWIGLLFLAGPLAWATSFYEKPFPDSVKEAPVIVRGKVANTWTDWGRGNDANKRIYTFWELQIEEILKGDAGGQMLVMRELGGEKDGVGMQVAGTAQFGRGEDVVVFLGEKNTEGTYDLWGMMMAKFSVQKDAEGQEFLIGPGINNLTQGRIGDGDVGHGAHEAAPKWTLVSLRRLIASQGDAPSAAPSLTPSKIPAVTPQPSPQSSATTVSLPAPLLQPTSAEESSSSARWALGAIALGLLMVLVAKRRK